MDELRDGYEAKGKDKRDMMYSKKGAIFLLAVMLAVILPCGCGPTGKEAMANPVNEADMEPEALSGNDIVEGDTANTEQKQESSLGLAEGKEEEVSGNDIGGSQGGREEETDSDVEDARREPVKVKGIYVSGPVAGIGKMDDLIALVEQTELNAMVIDIKNDEGKVTYKMQSDQVMEIDAGVGYIADMEGLVTKCKEKDIYLIARIVAFRDPYLAEQKPEWAVHTKDGEIFRDKSGLAWVNPYEQGVWEYLLEIASQAAEIGFDEIQFDYIRFSTDIREEEVDYGPEADRIDKIGIITQFTEYMYENLTTQGVYVAADVFGTVIDNEIDQEIVGQDYVQMAAHLDYICPMVYPSHYHNGSYGIRVPDAEPYRTIYEASASSVQELEAVPEENRAGVRVWLQGFTASWVPGHISYGPKQIRDQIKGAYLAGYDEWILWNAAVNYQRDALLTEEEAEAERQHWKEEEQGIEKIADETEPELPDGINEQPEIKGDEQPETVSGNEI